MQLLTEICEKDLDMLESGQDIEYKIRRAARAVIFDEDGNVALLYVTKDGYHKIPGGGIEEGESIKEALHREALEEAGCEIEITDELGLILEDRTQKNIFQINYCFIAKTKTIGEPNFTEKEKANGFKLEWLPIDEAIAIAEKDKPKKYMAKFMRYRDLIYLKKAKSLKEG
ncbi:MAG: NUDIX domain-containing protein [bacterium]